MDSKDLLTYVRRFRELAVDVQDPVAEDHLVKLCIERMNTTCLLHMVNPNFPEFFPLFIAAQNISETSCSLVAISPTPLPTIFMEAILPSRPTRMHNLWSLQLGSE